MNRVRFTPTARADLRAIYRYIAQENPRAAVAQVRAIKRKTQWLGTYPELGRHFPEYGEGLRGFPAGKYLIFYRPREDVVEIIHVYHSARDIPSLF